MTIKIGHRTLVIVSPAGTIRYLTMHANRVEDYLEQHKTHRPRAALLVNNPPEILYHGELTEEECQCALQHSQAYR